MRKTTVKTLRLASETLHRLETQPGEVVGGLTNGSCQVTCPQACGTSVCQVTVCTFCCG